MAIAAASLPRPAQFSHHQQDELDEKRAVAQQPLQPATVNGVQSKVLINPIAAYSQQLADKQLHIARITDDGVHWQRKEVADGGADTTAARRDGGYFKDKLLGRFSNKSSDTALSGGMLDREFGDDEHKAVVAMLDVSNTSSMYNGQAYDTKASSENECMHSPRVRSKLNGRTSSDETADNVDNTSMASKPNGSIAVPSDRLFKSDTPLPSPSNATSDSHDYYSDAPSAYATPVALAPTPSPLMGYHTPIDALDYLDATHDDTTQVSKSDPPPTEGGPANVQTHHTLNDSEAALSITTDSNFVRSVDPQLYIKPSTTTSRQQQDKKTPPPLTALHFLPQANVIPPTPPTASTAASFPQQASTSAVSLDTDALQRQQQQKRSSQQAPASPKSPRTPSSPTSSQPPLYLSPESIRKISPSHRRSQSYQPSTAPPRASTSSAGTATSSNPPLATPSLTSSQPPRRWV